ncbi:MAG: FAD-dependent oxidoreductase [Oscillospiraceae bacterium]|jgi:NAD(P)H-nitrite reductase large subunit|nr:FAD-dependent oxidoreductase [Oscillospiraceae bacterium]
MPELGCKYLIVGNSGAGIGAVEGIRRVDKTGKILMVSDEPYHTYSRPLISYLLWGKTDESRMLYRKPDFYEKLAVEFLPGTKIVSVHPEKKEAMTEDGRKITFEKALLGTGSVPFVPPMQGLEKVKEKFSFMTLDQAKALDSRLAKDKKILIVGAGLIGLKCAEGILERVGQVTVVDLAPTILSSILDPEGAAIIQNRLEQKGISFRLSQSVAAFTAETATLQSGEKISFDLLVLAVGVRPQTGLAKEAGLTVERGIVINETMQTSHPDIYAAGDCTQSLDVSSGQPKIMALLPNAYMQGECAGVNMAGGADEFTNAIPLNAIGFFGLHVATAGTYAGEVYYAREDQTYKKLFYADNALKGFILIGDVAKAGIYTQLIREQTPLDTLDFGLICEKPCLMAFSRRERARQLGGA